MPATGLLAKKGTRLCGAGIAFLAMSGTALAEGSGAPKDEVLFGNQWLALAVILAGVTVLTALVGLLGRWLAATHPDEAAKNS